MTEPLILQIQQAAIDSNSSVTDALRKAKIACVKLGLTEFGKWVDRELSGYMDMKVADLPPYRQLRGTPEGFNPYHGWYPIIFNSAQQQFNWSAAPIGMGVAHMEASLPKGKSRGAFAFPYPPDVKDDMLLSIQAAKDVRVRLEVPQIVGLLQAVRDILLEWTLQMEKEGVLGQNLSFSVDERAKSEAPTAEAISHIHIAQVGMFVQNADHSVLQGGVGSSFSLVQQAQQFVQQVEKLLPAAEFPAAVQAEAKAALTEIKEATAHHDDGRIRKGLSVLKRALAPAGETLLKIAVDAAVTKLLGQS